MLVSLDLHVEIRLVLLVRGSGSVGIYGIFMQGDCGLIKKTAYVSFTGFAGCLHQCDFGQVRGKAHALQPQPRTGIVSQGLCRQTEGAAL